MNKNIVLLLNCSTQSRFSTFTPYWRDYLLRLIQSPPCCFYGRKLAYLLNIWFCEIKITFWHVCINFLSQIVANIVVHYPRYRSNWIDCWKVHQVRCHILSSVSVNFWNRCINKTGKRVNSGPQFLIVIWRLIRGKRGNHGIVKNTSKLQRLQLQCV